MEDGIALSYGNALLRQSDLKIISQQNGWLNDRVIGFIFEHFEAEQYERWNGKFALITADVTQLIKVCSGDELGLILEPLQLKEKLLVVLAVNDNESKTVAGGSHWSLLVYHRHGNSFHHYDSFHSSNARSAKICALKLKSHLEVEDREYVVVMEMETPQQTNGHDCGVYMCLVAEYVLKKEFDKDLTNSLKEFVSPATVSQWRLNTIELIRRLNAQSTNSVKLTK